VTNATTTTKMSTAPRWRGVSAEERRREMARLNTLRTWKTLEPRIARWLANAAPAQVAELRARLNEYDARR
jgi:hypothetical protein